MHQKTQKVTFLFSLRCIYKREDGRSQHYQGQTLWEFPTPGKMLGGQVPGITGLGAYNYTVKR